MKRREFLRFFIMGGFLGIFSKKAKAIIKPEPKKAMFWRKIK